MPNPVYPHNLNLGTIPREENPLKTHLRCCTMVAVLATAGGVAPAVAQFDQAILMKWAGVQKVRYQVVGEFSDAKTMIIEGGYAAVKDRVELEFVFDQTGGGLLGAAKVTNHPSTVADIRDYGSNCDAPSISDPYEHATVTKAENGYGGELHLTTVRKLAGGAVSVQCTGGRKQVAAAAKEEVTQLGVPAPGLLALPKEELDESLQVFPRTDTIVVKDGGWTWTFKLSAVK